MGTIELIELILGICEIDKGRRAIWNKVERFRIHSLSLVPYALLLKREALKEIVFCRFKSIHGGSKNTYSLNSLKSSRLKIAIQIQ